MPPGGQEYVAVAGVEPVEEQVLLDEFKVAPVGQEYLTVAGAVVVLAAEVMEQLLPERV